MNDVLGLPFLRSVEWVDEFVYLQHWRSPIREGFRVNLDRCLWLLGRAGQGIRVHAAQGARAGFGKNDPKHARRQGEGVHGLGRQFPERDAGYELHGRRHAAL